MHIVIFSFFCITFCLPNISSICSGWLPHTLFPNFLTGMALSHLKQAICCHVISFPTLKTCLNGCDTECSCVTSNILHGQCFFVGSLHCTSFSRSNLCCQLRDTKQFSQSLCISQSTNKLVSDHSCQNYRFLLTVEVPS